MKIGEIFAYCDWIGFTTGSAGVAEPWPGFYYSQWLCYSVVAGSNICAEARVLT